MPSGGDCQSFASIVHQLFTTMTRYSARDGEVDVRSAGLCHACRENTDFPGTPGRTRTDTEQILSLVPLPLGYWGVSGLVLWLHITLLDKRPVQETGYKLQASEER